MSLKENLQKLKDGQPLKRPTVRNKARKKAAPKIKIIGKAVTKAAFTDRQFAHKLIQNNLNAKAAYLALKPDVTARTAEVEGSKLLRKPELIAILTPLLEKLFTEAGIDAHWVFQRWVQMSQATPLDYFTINDDGQPVLDMSDLTPAQRANLKEIKITDTKFGQNITVKVWDAQKATDQIGKHLGLLVEKLADEDIERIGDLIERGVKRIKATKDLDGWKSVILDVEAVEVK